MPFPIISVFVYLMIFAVIGSLWFLGLVAWLIGFFAKKAWLKWLGGIPLVISTLLGLAIAGDLAWDVYAAHSPPHVFKESFGFKAAPTTRFISGYWSVFGDSGVCELHFFADPGTVRQIVGTGFAEMPRDTFAKEHVIQGSPTRFFKKDPFGKGFAHDVAYLSVDDKTGEVYFRWDGVD